MLWESRDRFIYVYNGGGETTDATVASSTGAEGKLETPTVSGTKTE